MRRSLAAAVLFALAGCDNNAPAGDQPDGPIITVEPANDFSADQSSPAGQQQAGELPPPGPLPRFVGRWAADLRSCQSETWRFTATSLLTPAGSSCSFERISDVPGGYDIEATCTAEGPPTADTIEVRFAESAQAMMFESDVIADSGLVYCGRDV